MHFDEITQITHSDIYQFLATDLCESVLELFVRLHVDLLDPGVVLYTNFYSLLIQKCKKKQVGTYKKIPIIEILNLHKQLNFDKLGKNSPFLVPTRYL